MDTSNESRQKYLLLSMMSYIQNHPDAKKLLTHMNAKSLNIEEISKMYHVAVSLKGKQTMIQFAKIVVKEILTQGKNFIQKRFNLPLLDMIKPENIRTECLEEETITILTTPAVIRQKNNLTIQVASNIFFEMLTFNLSELNQMLHGGDGSDEEELRRKNKEKVNEIYENILSNNNFDPAIVRNVENLVEENIIKLQYKKPEEEDMRMEYIPEPQKQTSPIIYNLEPTTPPLCIPTPPPLNDVVQNMINNTATDEEEDHSLYDNIDTNPTDIEDDNDDDESGDGDLNYNDESSYSKKDEKITPVSSEILLGNDELSSSSSKKRRFSPYEKCSKPSMNVRPLSLNEIFAKN